MKASIARKRIPYGWWETKTRRIVIFDRQYHPLYEIEGNVVRRADPKEWVRGIVETDWFFDDGTPPDEDHLLEELAAKLAQEARVNAS